MELQVVLVVHREPFRRERDRHDHVGSLRDRVEARGHDADDGVRHVVQAEGLSEHVGPRAEAAGPQAMAEDHHLLAPRRVLVGGERAAERRRDAKDVEPGGRRPQAGDALRLAITRQVVAGKRAGRQRIDGRHPLAQVVEVTAGSPARTAPPGGVDRQHAVRLRVGEGSEDDRMDDAENGRRGAEANRQRQDDAEGEAAMLAGLAQGHAHVEGEVREPLPALTGAITVVAEGVECPGHLRRVAEPALGFGPRRRRVHSALDEIARPEIEVVRQLFAHLLIDGHPPQPRAQKAWPHRYTFTRTRLTAAENACQATVSLVNCWRPTRVSR